MKRAFRWEDTMGLAMSVGQLAFLRREDPEGYEPLLKAFADVNRVLEANGLPPHNEPEELPEMVERSTGVGQPYDMLHYLRRAVAHAMRGRKKLTPCTGDPMEDDLYDRVLFSCESHVICHSDCGGFYVPIDFPEPLYDDLPDDDDDCIEGGILGSSQGAMRELVLVAPLLKIRLTRGRLSDKEAAKIDKEEEGDTPFGTERYVWLKFYEAARLSIEYGTAIVFG
jgi:hypothetical protein